MRWEGPAATLCASSGPRLACLAPGALLSALRVLSLGTEGSGGAFDGRFFFALVEEAAYRQPRDRPGALLVSGPQGSCVSACVCVLSVRIYAKGAAPPVRLQAVDGGEGSPVP